MSYRIEQPLSAWRQVHFPSVLGFLMASFGLVAVIVEVNIRGWWGFATSGVDLLVILGWLGLSGGLSYWAFERAHSWWRALAFLGVLMSVVAVLAIVLLLVFRLLVEHPDLLKEKPRQRRGRKGSGRRRRRRSW